MIIDKDMLNRRFQWEAYVRKHDRGNNENIQG
jgi:hypothetical protein